MEDSSKIADRLLEQAVSEETRFLVVGIIDNDPVAPVRWASMYAADSARQAEDFAREEVHSEVVNGLHGHLLVAGVYQLSIDPMSAGNLVEIIRADRYARYTDPDKS